MFQRISNLIKGFLSLFISGIEKQNPEALLEAEKEHLREQIAKYNQGLASHAALCENLMAQVKNEETQERDLKAKTTANLRAGNNDIAGQYALQLQTVQGQLDDNRKALEQAEATYKQLTQARDVAITEAKAKLDTLKRGIDDLKVQRAMAELSEMASGMVSQIGGSGDTLDRLTEMVQDERNKAAGKARVARDTLDTSGVQMKGAEQSALAEQALADFAAKEGIPLETKTGSTQPSTDSAPKVMGPTTETPESSQ
jgi:phage shock protein A